MNFPLLTQMIKTFEDGLGDALVALYLVGSAATNYYMPGRSDVNLFMVIRDDTPLHQVQELSNAQWLLWAKDSVSPPAVAYQAAFLRHLRLNPALTRHMQENAQLLSGQVFAHFPAPGRLEVLATYCTAALNASVALAPGRSGAEIAKQAYNHLHRLARRLHNQPISDKATSRQLFIIVQRELQARLARLRNNDTAVPAPKNNLEAIYSKSQRVVFIIPEMGERELALLNWSTIAGSLNSQFQEIGVATPWQLRLSLFVDAPIDYALQRYERQWGRDVLPEQPVSRAHVYRALARDASDLLVNALPQRYLKAVHADEKYQVIHDLQNRVLNLHLQAELLRRMHGFPFSVPSIHLPGRETPVDQRIAVLHKRLDYWAAYYADAGEQNAAD